MKKFRQKMAEKAGFTLVELIVVIAILGILAAVAVPAYTGYVKKANDAKVLSELTTMVTAAQSVAVEKGAGEVKSISVASDGSITVDPSGVTGKDIATYASNVDSASGKIKDWDKVTKGSSYEGKSIAWSSDTLKWQ